MSKKLPLMAAIAFRLLAIKSEVGLSVFASAMRANFALRKKPDFIFIKLIFSVVPKKRSLGKGMMIEPHASCNSFFCPMGICKVDGVRVLAPSQRAASQYQQNQQRETPYDRLYRNEFDQTVLF